MIIHNDVTSIMKMLENFCSKKAFLNCICIICPIIYVLGFAIHQDGSTKCIGYARAVNKTSKA